MAYLKKQAIYVCKCEYHSCKCKIKAGTDSSVIPNACPVFVGGAEWKCKSNNK